MVRLSGLGELPVGPEVNDFGQVQEGERARGASDCRRRQPAPVPSLIQTPTLYLRYLPQMNLAEQHVLGSKNTYYIPDFVTTDEETYLLRKVSWPNSPVTHSGSGFNVQLLIVLYTDSGDASAEMEATFEPEVCCMRIVVFRASKQESATGCRHGVTPLSENTPNISQLRTQVVI